MLYRAIDRSDDAVLIVETDGNGVTGFVTGGSVMGPIYRQMIRDWPNLIPALRPIVFQPRKVLGISPLDLDTKSFNSRCSPDLAAPEGRVLRREVAIRDPEISLQLDDIVGAERHHGLEPERGGEGDVGGGNFAKGTADFGRTVQDEPPAHAGRGAVIDLVEQRRAEDVGAIRWHHEPGVGGVEGALIVIVFDPG
ncbi:hypothetical protein ACSSV8_003203 [Roseovarius sp. MBR-79]